MQAGKRGLFVLRDLQLHTLGLFRDLPRLKPTRSKDATATTPAGSFDEAKVLRAALECKKAEAYYRAQRVFNHPR